MNKKQLIVAWAMGGCILYVLSCFMVVHGTTPIKEQPLDKQLMEFVHNNFFTSLFLVLIFGVPLIYFLRDRKKPT